MSTNQASIAPKAAALSLGINIWLLVLPLLGMSVLLVFRCADMLRHVDSAPALLALPLAGALLALQVKQNSFTSNRLLERRLQFALVLFSSAIALFLIAVYYFLPWLAAICALLVLASWSILRFDRLHWAKSIAWIGVLVPMILAPTESHTGISNWLISCAATNCSLTLDALGVPNILLGSNVELVDRLMVCLQLCRGFGNFFVFTSFIIGIVVFQRRAFLTGALTSLLCPVWMVFGHYVLLTSIALAATYLNHDLSSGLTYHFLAVFSFFFAFVSAWLTSLALDRVFDHVEQPGSELRPAFGLLNHMFCWPGPPPVHTPTESEDREVFEAEVLERQHRLDAMPRAYWFERNWAKWTIQVGACLMVLVGMLPAIVLTRGIAVPTFSERRVSQTLAERVSELSLPEQISDAAIKALPSEEGQHSKSWAIQTGQRNLTLTISHSPHGWHDPTVELVHQGWTPMLKIRIEQFGNRNWGIFGTSVQTELGAFIYMFNSMLSEKLEQVDLVPNFDGNMQAAESAYQRKTIFDLLRGETRNEDATGVQVLLVVNSGEQLLEAEINELVQLYDTLRRKLIHQD